MIILDLGGEGETLHGVVIAIIPTYTGFLRAVHESGPRVA